MMSLRVVSCLFVILFMSACSSTVEKQETSIIEGKELTLEWEVIENGHADKNNYVAELRLINNSSQPLKSNHWKLYFNNSPCREVVENELSNNFSLRSVAGDFMCLQPSKSFKEVAPKDTAIFKFVGGPWVIKEGDAPCGFYFVFDEETSPRIEVPSYNVKEFKDLGLIKRGPNDKVVVPINEVRFIKNSRLRKLALKEVPMIIPTPSSMDINEGELTINEEFEIVYGQQLENESSYLNEHLEKVIRSKLTSGQKKTTEKGKYINLQLTTQQKQTNGGYKLEINTEGITIIGDDAEGVFYGVQSLRALIPISAYNDQRKSFTVPFLQITDAPRFAYRGMHLDVARNFQSKESVLQLLEMMSFYKLNKFHFHLVDDEGWRLEIEELPELTEIGSKRGHTLTEKDRLMPQYGSGPFEENKAGTGYFSRTDFIEILTYAKRRHIEVIPEIDVPGHARAAIKAMEVRYESYKEKGNMEEATRYLLNDPEDQSSYRSVQNYTDNIVCVCQQSTINFLEVVLDDIIEMYQEANADLTTIHVGGDEVPHGVWEESPQCDQLFAENEQLTIPHDLKEYFLEKLSDLTNKRGLSLAGWEEIALHLEKIEGAPQEKKTVNPKFTNKNFSPYVWNNVYGWGGEEVGYKLANAGYGIVLCNVSDFYFDMAWDKDPKEHGLYWGGFVTAEEPYKMNPFNVYSTLKFDLNGNPIAAAELTNKEYLTEAGRANIRGIQGHLWTETVKTKERMEYMIYPRLMMLAERAWASEPVWVKEPSRYTAEWNKIANAISQRELPRMDVFFGGLHYKLPTPGAMITDGQLSVNTEFPGTVVRYTSDGTNPNQESPVYTVPITVTEGTTYKMRAFNYKGDRGGNVVTVK